MVCAGKIKCYYQVAARDRGVGTLDWAVTEEVTAEWRLERWASPEEAWQSMLREEVANAHTLRWG